MNIHIDIAIPDFEQRPYKLPDILRRLAHILENDPEPDTNVMDGSLNIKDTAGNTVGKLSIDWDY